MNTNPSSFTLRPRSKQAIYLLLSLLLLGCASPTATDTPAISEASSIQVILVSTDFAVGESRVSFALFDGPDPATDVTQVNLIAVEPNAENVAPVWQGTAENYSDYEIPYWVAYPTIPQAGFWGMIAQLTRSDGSTSETTFVLEVNEASKAPNIGTKAPASQNRTLATEPDLTKLSSGNEANPDLYQLTIAEAIANNKPTVIAFATPGLCQTQWCTPVLESVEATMTQTGDTTNFIHVEVYQDFQTLTLVPEMAEWGLDTEPWVFVLDKNGHVHAKLSGPVSAQELQSALNSL